MFHKTVSTMLMSALMASATAPAFGQDDPNAATVAETARINAEKDRLKAETDKINAQAELDRARVTSLGLPTYQGTTKLTDGAGVMEATLLTTPAVRLAGDKIGEAVTGSKPVILLGRDDAIDFGLPGSMTAELDGLARQFGSVLMAAPAPAPGMHPQFIAGAVAVISAIAGLVRTDSEVTAAAVTVSDAELVTAVAAKLKSKAILPASAIGTIQVATNGSNSPLLTRLGNVATQDSLAQEKRDRLASANGNPPDPSQKAQIDAIDAVRKRYDAFFARVVSADAQGVVPIARAARLELLLAETDGVLRVHVEKSGGSLINNKNIGTFFGADPVRVSGGLVASYVLTSPNDGKVTSAGIIQCRTTLARLRRIQDGKAFTTDGANKQTLAVCL